MRFSMIRRCQFVQCVPARTSPVAVRLQYTHVPHSVPETRLPTVGEVVRQASVGRAAEDLEVLIVGGDNDHASLLGEG